MELLERLARANSEPGAPDSMEYAPVSWSELDRNSFNEGLQELLAYQEERALEEERKQIEEVRRQALHRARQRRDARKWEKEFIERQRAEALERRMEEARKRALEEVEDELSERRARLSTELKVVAHENAWEREVVKAKIVSAKKHWARTSQALLAAAALVGVVWFSAYGQSRTSGADEQAQAWEQAQAQELSAETRVAELEAEIDRRRNLSESERAWLEEELGQARAALDASKKEREEVDRRRPVERPSKMASTLVPVKTPQVSSKAQESKQAPSSSSVRVATDGLGEDGCVAYDPLCFNL